MKIPELRALAGKYSKEELQYLVVELYRAMPKKLKEEKEIDKLFLEPGQVGNHTEQGKKTVSVDLRTLGPEIEEFLENAYQQNYMVPNRVIPKKDRPKWRFLVKSYIRSLQKVPAADGVKAAELLEKLYRMLCYSCCYYLFNTEDPFRSVGIEQTEIYDMVASKLLENDMSREHLRRAVELAVLDGLDRWTLPEDLFAVLLRHLKIPDTRQAAREEAEKLREEAGKKWAEQQKGRKGSGYSRSEFWFHERNNHLTELIFHLYAHQGEFEQGIQDYKNHSMERDPEITLYRLLRLLAMYDEAGLWKQEYEKAVKKKISPRTQLQKVYQYVTVYGQLPEGEA